MGISKISSLFAANVDAPQGNQVKRQTNNQEQQGSNVSGEAVTFSSTFNGQETGVAERAQRVATLKASYERGALKPDSQKTAVALIRDLM